MPKAIPTGLKRQHILLALKDIDAGMEHGFKEPIHYELVYKGKRYPPKAVVGVAFRHLTGSILPHKAFSGGGKTGQANAALRDLGFTVERKTDATPKPLTTHQIRILRVLALANDWLTRKDIVVIVRSNIGVNKGFDKGYADAMGAPTTGMIAPNSLEGRGFVTRKATTGTNRELEYRITPAGIDALSALRQGDDIRRDLKKIEDDLEEHDYFDLSKVEDLRDRRLREVVQRRGQPGFRLKLIAAYKGRCAVTGCDVHDALEAAHITPYLGQSTNHVTNGLLLRADIHSLLDLNLFGIEPHSYRVVLADSIKTSTFSDLDGKSLTLPMEQKHRPSKKALQQRWREFTEDVAGGPIIASDC